MKYKLLFLAVLNLSVAAIAMEQKESSSNDVKRIPVMHEDGPQIKQFVIQFEDKKWNSILTIIKLSGGLDNLKNTNLTSHKNFQKIEDFYTAFDRACDDVGASRFSTIDLKEVQSGATIFLKLLDSAINRRMGIDSDEPILDKQHLTEEFQPSLIVYLAKAQYLENVIKKCFENVPHIHEIRAMHPVHQEELGRLLNGLE